MRYIVQSVAALAALIGLPVFLDEPASLEGRIAAGVGALILAGAAFHGVVRFVHSRRPRIYPDSVIAPKEPPKPKA
jgi:hypothetical protein